MPSGVVDVTVTGGLVLLCAAGIKHVVDRLYERVAWRNVYARAAITAVLAGVGGVVAAYTILGTVQ
ncbi:hypothetical protein SAMN06269185_1266 [Natronoarchaeum philippinense]|uniref:Uncharacterized protein n=1 Tax=Natronoarchaeum philippinense TaxID=558529 RepID=A0A285NB61_NATPI|nr:hypothetical protein [Natronoarchaeum philippinense]SNZ06724.1 hypothetical protein SAMN06269185_1266 [Natronoarchaeum philippinense]